MFDPDNVEQCSGVGRRRKRKAEPSSTCDMMETSHGLRQVRAEPCVFPVTGTRQHKKKSGEQANGAEGGGRGTGSVDLC